METSLVSQIGELFKVDIHWAHMLAEVIRKEWPQVNNRTKFVARPTSYPSIIEIPLFKATQPPNHCRQRRRSGFKAWLRRWLGEVLRNHKLADSGWWFDAIVEVKRREITMKQLGVGFGVPEPYHRSMYDNETIVFKAGYDAPTDTLYLNMPE